MSTAKPNRRRFIGNTLRGASTVGVAAVSAATLAFPAGLRAGDTKPAKKVIGRAGEPPKRDALLSSAIQLGNLLFVSGAGAHDPKTHKVVAGPFSNQVKRCLDNIKSVLEAAGSSLDRVLKCTVFLTDIANFQAMNEVYHTYFPLDAPARSTIAVKDLPADSPIEIECVAYVD